MSVPLQARLPPVYPSDDGTSRESWRSGFARTVAAWPTPITATLGPGLVFAVRWVELACPGAPSTDLSTPDGGARATQQFNTKAKDQT